MIILNIQVKEAKENKSDAKTNITKRFDSFESRSETFYESPYHIKNSPASIKVHHHGKKASKFDDRRGLGFIKAPHNLASLTPKSNAFAFSTLIGNHKARGRKPPKPVPPPLFYGHLTPSSSTERYQYIQKSNRPTSKPQSSYESPPKSISYAATGTDSIHAFSSPGEMDHDEFTDYRGDGGYGHNGIVRGHSDGGPYDSSGGGGYDHSGPGLGGGGYGHSSSGGAHSGSGSGHDKGGYGHSGSSNGHDDDGYIGYGGHSDEGDHGKCYGCDEHKDPGYKPSKKPGPYGYPSPNFKCEYEKETLYVTKTEYKFTKKCFTVFSTSCRKEHAVGKGIGFEKVCNEFSVTR